MPEPLTINRQKNQGIKYHLLVKLILIVTIVFVGGIAVLDFFFIDQLAKFKLDQLYETGETTSIVTSELALSSMYSRKQQYISQPLSQLFEKSSIQNDFLLQISVILFPSGIYYASTNENFKNRNIHPSLLQKLNQHKGKTTHIEKINYKIENKTITVLQFLRNIIVNNDKEEIHVATTQVLYNYSLIIDKTRQTLFMFGGITLVGVVLILAAIYFPISRDHLKLIEALKQVKKKNFDYKLAIKSKDEIGTLFTEYNDMVESVRYMLLQRSNGKLNGQNGDHSDLPSEMPDLTLRKTELTCLCTRIPKIQQHIQVDDSGSIASFVKKHLEPIDNASQSHGGQIVKIIGDKVFVLFEGINSIDNAIRAALKCNQKWKTINHERKVLGKEFLEYGIGLHSEIGLVGGLATSLENFTIIGEAASIAEYLCTCSSREEVLISSSMMEKTNGSYQHQGIENLNRALLLDEEVFILTGGVIPESELTDQNGEGVSLAGMNGDFENTHERSYDASIPDILEETLSTSPLELVGIEEKETDIKLSQNITENSFKDIDTVEFNDIPIDEELIPGKASSSSSLWKKISSEIKTEEE
ncbi:MAG: adenylate/guanylate cyclase domain-containing protein [Deltaproteobacteria bacterium]|jgi:class 3 adenylate cyclase|nr:adenylate/guanylate cyclase domain-containing protein [Deltaproteobacteria bacterium]MBT4527762.1 adenylate/guanylate cyclase domain-containing protein [Deltaproteobacteria bacterium]